MANDNWRSSLIGCRLESLVSSTPCCRARAVCICYSDLTFSPVVAKIPRCCTVLCDRTIVRRQLDGKSVGYSELGTATMMQMYRLQELVDLMNLEHTDGEQPSLLSDDDTSEKMPRGSSEDRMTKIYFDTNQLYYIRRIAEEAEGWEYGDYEWAYRAFPNNPQLAQDIRALCYIVALQYEWELDFYSSDASFTEVCRSASRRAQDTRDAWMLFAEGLEENRILHRVPFLPDWPVSGRLSLEFIDDPVDRVILRHFASEGDGVLLTSDDDILRHRERLAQLKLVVMRPSEWLDAFLAAIRGGEDAVGWIERTLFGIQRIGE